MPSNTLVQSIENSSDLLITIQKLRKRYWLFGRVEECSFKQYRGEGTVWHQYPDGQRCSTTKEEHLANIAKRHQWVEESSHEL